MRTAITPVLSDDRTRVYLTGNTFDVKGMIKNYGGSWDDVRRKWYLSAKTWPFESDVLTRLVAQLNSNAEAIRLEGSNKAVATATFKGQQYNVLWAGKTSRGSRAARIIAPNDIGDGFWVGYTTSLAVAANMPNIAYISPAELKAWQIPPGETGKSPVEFNDDPGTMTRFTAPRQKARKAADKYLGLTVESDRPSGAQIVTPVVEPPPVKQPPVKLKRKVKL